MEEVDRLNGFVTGLLGFAKETPPKQDAVALRPLVDAAAQLCAPVIEAQQITLAIEGDAAPARGDAQHSFILARRSTVISTTQ